MLITKIKSRKQRFPFGNIVLCYNRTVYGERRPLYLTQLFRSIVKLVTVIGYRELMYKQSKQAVMPKQWAR